MQNPKKRLLIFLAVLLAVLCIAGAELLACRIAEPALYNAIMSPVRAAAQRTAQTGSALINGAAQAGRSFLDGAAQVGRELSRQIGETSAAIQAQWEEFTTPPPPPPAEADMEETTLSEPNASPTLEILDPSVSDLIYRDGVEVLTGGGVDVIYFNQTDDRWEDETYGTDPIRTHGCGPTVMSMAVSSLTDEMVDPAEMADLCVKKGYWAKKHGSYHAIVPGIAEAYGLDCTPMPPEEMDTDSVFTHLATGDLIVALVIKGHFTNGGHFILLRGTTLGGEVLVADPASRERSLSAWDLDLIIDELSHNRISGSPFWILSTPRENLSAG